MTVVFSDHQQFQPTVFSATDILAYAPHFKIDKLGPPGTAVGCFFFVCFTPKRPPVNKWMHYILDTAPRLPTP